MDRTKLRSNPMLRTRDGRLFLVAQSLDALAGGVASVALPWLVLDASGSTSLAGLIWVLEFLPYVVFGLPAGLAGDRVARRRLIWVGHAIEGAFAVIVPLWAIAAGTPPIAIIAIAAFAIGSARAFSDAGAFGAVASLVGPEQFTTGQSLLSSSWACGMLIGPAIGGVLIGSIGAAPTLFLQAAAFGIAALLILLVRSSFGDPAPSTSAKLDGLLEGVRFLIEDPMLRTLTTVGFAWNIACAGSGALLVPLLRHQAGLSSHQAGFALALGAVAAIVSAPILHRLQRHYDGPDLYLRLIFLSAPPLMVLALADGFAAACVGVAAMYLVNWIVMSTFIGERQKRAPQSMQARVGISGRMLMTLSNAVGGAIASGLAGAVALRDLYAVMAVATVVVGIAAVPLLGRAIRRAALA